ncbi:hypothetical protein PENNAL_c0085G00991 [Penicillium nalgiovense]|uniref:Uncharacterized protein n=1 Tax=Penicillium nalgiovense TaxID=60175 RepID=A0A1V6XFT7_PENNA|nr:hypothetical protein PENNAL_c0085G00991 [Penicillium nalgiovense]
MDATQSLALQYHFNPANSPSGDSRLIRAIVSLRVALDKSRAEESSAEQEWKQQWKVSSTIQHNRLSWVQDERGRSDLRPTRSSTCDLCFLHNI